MTTTEPHQSNAGALTDEGPQEITSRSVTAAGERLRELGAVLRLSEAEAAQLEADAAPEDETMVLNMGPQHPSTHGVLRLMLELRGETVVRTKPIVGYLHTGMEWQGGGGNDPPGPPTGAPP